VGRSATLAASWCVWVLVSFCIVVAPPARADQVTLKNGDRLTGTIVKSDELLSTGLRLTFGKGAF
jgi:hypothetical protein